MPVNRLIGPAVALVAAGLMLTSCSDIDRPSAAPASGGAPAGAETRCPAGSLAAAGSSAQKNAIEHLIIAYSRKCPAGLVSYDPTGSGDGIKQFLAGRVDFAGSDSALRSTPKDGTVEAEEARKRCGGNPAYNLPMVIGPIAIAYNLAGVDRLVLDGPTAAKIFEGDITRWNDADLVRLNPGVRLPAADITVFHRSDDSGTTENFSTYLEAVGDGGWRSDPGKKWTGTGTGRAQSAGVTEGVRTTPGSITYVDWSYAVDNSLGIARIKTAGGVVELTPESASKALGAARLEGSGNDLRLSVDYTTAVPDAYPIILVTYEIACSRGLPPDKTALLKSFLGFAASAEGQASLAELSNAPLPETLRRKVDAAVQSIR